MRIVICFPNVICAAVTPRLESIWIGIDGYVSWTKIAKLPPASCVWCKTRSLALFVVASLLYYCSFRKSFSNWLQFLINIQTNGEHAIDTAAVRVIYGGWFLQKRRLMRLIIIVLKRITNVFENIISLPNLIFLKTKMY